jgi:AAA+ ATPase superfamily predicted ATPase
MFVDRQEELAFFNRILTRKRPGPAQLILLYGRRRVGKTALLLHWAAQSKLPYTYWSAEKEPASLQRRKLYARWQNIPIRQAPIFDSWLELWEAVANLSGLQRRILILDELPYVSEADPAALSALQHAWDHYFQHSSLVIVLCGSQVKVMESLQFHQSPLFGRLTGQWHLQPFSFAALGQFLPNWSLEERVAAYAIVGGIPAYLNWLDPDMNLVENIQQVILSEGGMFLAEPTFLLYDEVREPRAYLAVLKAIGSGYHTMRAISNETLIASSHLSAHLSRLQELKMVERRLPATIPPAKRRRSRQGRYHLQDPFFRFYFRFIAPFHQYLPLDMDRVLNKVRQELRAFVGQTTFEILAQEWVVRQGKNKLLAFEPDIVGAHWSRRVQIDVVAVQWQTRQILLGECKWGREKVSRKVVRELVEQKTAHLRRDLAADGEAWQIHYAIFSRAGLTDAALNLLGEYGGTAVDLTALARGLE